MKKKFLVVAMTFVLAITMLAGCGGGTSKKDYLNDLEELVNVSDVDVDTDDPDEMIDSMNDLIKGLKMSTPEGKKIKSDMQELVKLLEKMAKMEDADYDEIMEIYSDYMDLVSKLEDDFEKFGEAAEDAGVDEDDLEDMDFDFDMF